MKPAMVLYKIATPGRGATPRVERCVGVQLQLVEVAWNAYRAIKLGALSVVVGG